MKTCSLDEACASFFELVERALAGEPQRVIRHGKKAVVIVSEEQWHSRGRAAPTLGALLAQYARRGLMHEPIRARPWKDRSLGSNFK